MLPKLPSNAALKSKIETKAVQASIAFLMSRRATLTSFRFLEDLFVDAPEPLSSDLSGAKVHLETVFYKFQTTLYSYSVFIGASVLNQIVFDMVRADGVDDPIGRALDLIRSSGMHKPGIILYPLHSLGLLGVGLMEKLSRDRLEFFAEEGDVWVRGQTNSLKETIHFIERAAAGMGINRSVPRDSIEHYSRSRPTKWLTHNPLLLLRARTFSGSYYENQRYLMVHLERACSLLFMLSTLENGFPVKREQHFFSTSRINNWETQDIFHFLLFEPRAGNPKKFESQCVPMNYRAVELAELSNVNVEINLQSWTRRMPIMSRICDVLSGIESGYLRSNILGRSDTPKARVFHKLMTSLRYFRRSFRYTSGEDNVINLTTALEVLLTDSYAPQVGDRLRERTALLLRGHKRRTACIEAVERVYDARNQAVHSGVRNIEVDLPTVQEAFVLCLLKIAERVRSLPRETPDPMTRLILHCGP